MPPETEPTVTIGDPSGTPPTPPNPPESPWALSFELGATQEAVQSLRAEIAECRAEQDRLNGAVADLASTLASMGETLALVIAEEEEEKIEERQETRAPLWARCLGSGA